MGNWRQLAAMPAARYQAGAAWHAGKVYVFGGSVDFATDYFQNNTYIYDPTGNTWTTGTNLPATGLCYAFSTAADGVHVVFPSTGAHYAYDPDVGTWATRASVPGPTRRRAHHFVDSTGRFYLAAGQNVSGYPSASVKVYRYDPATDAWTARADAPSWMPDPAVSPGVLGGDDKVYMTARAAPENMVVYDPAADTWATTPNLPTPRGAWTQVSRLPSGIVLALGVPDVPRTDGYNPSTGTWTMGVIPDYPGGSYLAAVVNKPGGEVYLIGGTADDAAGLVHVTSVVWAYKQNEPPTVATLLTLTGGVLVSTAAKNRARHQFNDPNAGDSQSKFDWRYRIVGDPTWITGTEVTPNPWHDIDAGTLDPGNYERQVLTYDAAGEPAPAWTPSGFFTAADPPAGPAITYPINGQILDQIEYVEWSIPAQDSYQVRRVADDGAGNPDTGTVYYDTGEVVDTLARKIPLTFTVNSRTEHVQVRIKDGGLWSDWDSVSGAVSFTPPPAPTFTVYPDPSTGSLLVMISTPDPAPGDPAAVSVNVYITEPLPNGQVVEERRATELPITTGWRYWLVVGGWEYDGGRIRVESVAANGTTASST